MPASRGNSWEREGHHQRMDRAHARLAARMIRSATADGAIWYTGQFANVLGRLDPKTGKIKEYPLTPKAGPHGLTADKDGNIWYTANFGSRVGKLNPKTGELTRISHAQSCGARSAHADFRSKGNSLVHRPGETW